MFENKWWKLQLFAEGAPAGDGGASGEAGAAESGATAPAAGEQELLNLGVPKNRITRRASAAVANAGKGSTKGKPAQQAAAAAATEEGTKENATAAKGFQIPDGVTVDDIIGNPEVNKAIQGIVGKRVNASKADSEAMTALRPALEVLARAHNLDPANLDYVALSKAVENDDRYYEDLALANGVDVETARQMDAEDRKNRRQQETMRQEHMQQQVASWRQEEAQLKAQGIAIDLNKEAENPTFVNLLRAGFGVKGAYEAVHHAEIVAAARQAAFSEGAAKTVSDIRSGNHRPGELGSSQTPAAPSQRKLSRADHQAIRARLERGQTVDPRDYGIF